MRMTDLWDDRIPAAASARRRPWRVRPPSPMAPIRRKLRRDRWCGTTGAVRPWRVGMGSLTRYGEAGLGLPEAGGRLGGRWGPGSSIPAARAWGNALAWISWLDAAVSGK